MKSMKIPRSDQEQVLKLELALALYQGGILAMGPARRLAGTSKREFLCELFKFLTECWRPAITIRHKNLQALQVIQKFLLAGKGLSQAQVQLSYGLEGLSYKLRT